MAEHDETLDRIQQLAHEEHELRERAAHERLSDEEHRRLEDIEVALDRCWDLLRQRRAKREFGEDPDDARLRSADTVEGYVR